MAERVLSNRLITEEVCFKTGHKIVSLPVKTAYDPASKSTFTVYEILCERCGVPLEDKAHPSAITIRTYRSLNSTARNRRKENVAEVSS